jgi:hypothetical protein
MPFVESQLKKENLIIAGKIVTKAVLGFDGQGEYEMIIKFAEYSLNHYVQGYDLADCLPSEESMVWITLYIYGKIIELRLK